MSTIGPGEEKEGQFLPVLGKTEQLNCHVYNGNNIFAACTAVRGAV